MIQGIASEVASSSTSSSTSTHNASRDFSPDCQEVPSGTTCPRMGSLLNIPEDSIERKESVTSNMYNSVTDQFPAATQQQVNKYYTRLSPTFFFLSINTCMATHSCNYPSTICAVKLKCIKSCTSQSGVLDHFRIKHQNDLSDLVW